MPKAPEQKRPGGVLIPLGLSVLVLGFLLLLVNVSNPVTSYVPGVGSVTTQSPSAGSIIMMIAGLLLAGIGYARRLLAAVEKR